MENVNKPKKETKHPRKHRKVLSAIFDRALIT